MESLTGLTGFYWIIFSCYALSLALVGQSARREPDGGRVGPLLVVPLVAGLTLIAFLAVVFRGESRYLFANVADRAGSIPVALATLLGAVAVVDLFFARFATPVLRPLSALGLAPRTRADLALLLGVGAPIAILLATLPQLDAHFPAQAQGASGEDPALGADYRLPGQPLDLELRSPTSGYLSFAHGAIAMLELDADGTRAPRVTPLATELEWPRGLAVMGTTLFVAELGPLPCEPAFPRCKGGDLGRESVSEGEREIIRTSRARVVALDIGDDGGLSNRRVILRDLPVVNTDHGLNDLVVGPDDRLYLAIGHLDTTYRSERVESDLQRPNAELLGTVVSFEPDGSDLRVYARGLRNVYGLAFDSRGQLYGAENSGPTRSGDRREELLRIEEGADYGYPDVPRAPSTPPSLGFLDTVGSGGIAWLPGAGGGRLVLGSCGALDTVRLSYGPDGEPRVAPGARVTRTTRLPGCVTAIGSGPGGFVVTLFTAGPRGKVYLVPSRLP